MKRKEGLKQINGASQRSEQVYDTITEAILCGEFSPGDRLKVENLASKLDVSATPIRQALARLENDGLVSYLPYQGYTVKVFTKEEAWDLVKFRACLESWAASEFSKQITKKEIQILGNCLKRCEDAFNNNNMSSYKKSHNEFHSRILVGSGNNNLLNALKAVSLRLSLLATMRASMSKVTREALKKHKAILEAIQSGDATKASKLLNEHIIVAGQKLMTLFDDKDH